MATSDTRPEGSGPGPLAGRKVLVTRAPEQAQEMVQQLAALGADVSVLPAISFAVAQDTKRLDQAIASLDSFDWLLFTSSNAVRFFSARTEALGRLTEAKRSGQCRIGVVGPATAEAAKQHGFAVDFVASRFGGEALVAELGVKLAGKKVLLPRSDRARPELPEALRRAGAEVTEVIAYRTVFADASDSAELEALRREEIDVITFASPSAVHSLAEMVGPDVLSQISAKTAFAAIGPTTAQAIRDAGLRVAIEASTSSAAGLAAAIASYYTHSSSSGVATR